MNKIRGFEKISFSQFRNDIKPLPEDKYDNIKLPHRATTHSAGYDIFALEDIIINPNEMKTIPTGIKAYMQNDEWFSIHVRSGHGFKFNIRLKNQVGIIDADYYNNQKNEGHIFIALQNEGTKTLTINKGEAFAQGIFHKYLVIDNDSTNLSRNGGFGSTDENNII